MPPHTAGFSARKQRASTAASVEDERYNENLSRARLIRVIEGKGISNEIKGKTCCIIALSVLAD